MNENAKLCGGLVCLPYRKTGLSRAKQWQMATLRFNEGVRAAGETIRSFPVDILLGYSMIFSSVNK